MNHKQKQISKAFKTIRETIEAKEADDIRPLTRKWIESNLHRAKNTGHVEICFHFSDLDDMFPLFFCKHEENYYWQYNVTRTEIDYIKGRKIADVFVSVLVEDLCVKCDHPWPKA